MAKIHDIDPRSHELKRMSTKTSQLGYSTLWPSLIFTSKIRDLFVKDVPSPSDWWKSWPNRI